ncbi:hypothetical protein [Puia sp.]|jgi:hypothetical protein|uniref:hypothetical protein n=1 Tax=Puia sp. TaxID=2045100 RepID=UPI002F3FAD3E
MNIYLDIAISLLLIFVVFSVVVYVIQEVIAINFEYRGKMLWSSLAQALDGLPVLNRRGMHKGLPEDNAALTGSLFDHAQIRGLMKGNVTLPSYIHSADFAKAVIDVLAAKAPAPGVNKLADFISGLNVQIGVFQAAHPGKSLPPVLDIFRGLAAGAPDLAKLESDIEGWYNRYMARVSGWYQSHVVATVRIIAVGVTLFFNINVFQLGTSIAGDSTMRTNLVGIAERVADHPDQVTALLNKKFDTRIHELDSLAQPNIDSAVKSGDAALANRLRQALEERREDAAKVYTGLRIHAVDSLTRTLSAVKIPIGWHLDQLGQELKPNGSLDWGAIGLLLLGWLITAGCLSMGAPFWFGLLIQFVNIRRAGTKPGGDKKS